MHDQQPMMQQGMSPGQPNALMALDATTHSMTQPGSSAPGHSDLGLLEVGPQTSPIARAMMAFAETMSPLMMAQASMGGPMGGQMGSPNPLPGDGLQQSVPRGII